jgi:hypothetical protein
VAVVVVVAEAGAAAAGDGTKLRRSAATPRWAGANEASLRRCVLVLEVATAQSCHVFIRSEGKRTFNKLVLVRPFAVSLRCKCV